MTPPDDGLRALIAFAGGGAMIEDVDLFHFEPDRPSFESYAKENGFKFWLASQLVECLGYTNMAPVLKAVQKAIAACVAIEVPIGENFTEITEPEHDWKLSRFACYLTVMNGDVRNPKVAAAQAYFVTMAEAFRQYVEGSASLERVVIRGELSDREKVLSGRAHAHGVENYPFFQNAGYRGMYNMNLSQIRVLKGVPAGRSPLDFMGKTELAANLFRITQTDEKILNQDVRGQKPLEYAAETVGREVRNTMHRVSGTRPEALAPAKDMREVKRGLKQSQKGYKKLDGPKKKAPWSRA